MFSVLRCTTSESAAVCYRFSLNRFYATDVSAASRQKWRLAGARSPRSILDDDDTPVDLTEDNDAVNGVRPNTPPLHRRAPSGKSTPHEFSEHRKVMKKKFPEGWAPPRKLSREAMDGLRQLHHFDGKKFTTPVLAEKFRISPEAVRRILKSKWEPPKEKREKQVEKERKEKQEIIMLSRLRERVAARQLAELNKSVPKGQRDRDGHTTGINWKDKLTFE